MQNEAYGEVLKLVATLLLGGTGGGWLLAWRREKHKEASDGPKDQVALVALLHRAQAEVVLDLHREMELLRSDRDRERKERLSQEQDFERRLHLVETGRDYEQVAAAAAVAWATALLGYIARHWPDAKDIPEPSPGLKVYMQTLASDWALRGMINEGGEL